MVYDSHSHTCAHAHMKHTQTHTHSEKWPDKLLTHLSQLDMNKCVHLCIVKTWYEQMCCEKHYTTKYDASCHEQVVFNHTVLTHKFTVVCCHKYELFIQSSSITDLQALYHRTRAGSTNCVSTELCVFSSLVQLWASGLKMSCLTDSIREGHTYQSQTDGICLIRVSHKSWDAGSGQIQHTHPSQQNLW